MKPKVWFAKDRFKVILVSNDMVRPMIETNHYLHRWPANPQYCFAVIHDDTRMVGAIVLGGPVRRELNKSISPLLSESEVAELLRVWIEDGDVRNGFGCGLESWAIAQSFRILKGAAPEKSVVVSYADPSVGHIGRVYQALNGIYQELPSKPGGFQINLLGPNEREHWIHSRTIQRRFGRHSERDLKFKVGKTFWKRKDTPKYRYLWFLRRREEIMETLIYGPSPYPKATVTAPEVEEISITE